MTLHKKKNNYLFVSFRALVFYFLIFLSALSHTKWLSISTKLCHFSNYIFSKSTWKEKKNAQPADGKNNLNSMKLTQLVEKITKMHFWPSILLVLLLFLSNFGSGVNGTSCINDQQFTVSNISCALCIQGNGPARTSSICFFRRCVTIEACSLQFSGTCKKESDCITNSLCL
jgi:hypothetical protein